MKQKKVIYYDTETTGTRTDKDRIIEIAGFDPVENRTFVQLVNPGIPIPIEASSISKITDDMVKEADSFAIVGKAFIEFCGENAVLIAHNNDSFDKPMIQNEFKRCNLMQPEWNFVDSLKWSRKYRSDLPRHSLQHLREVYQIPPNQAHRALDDVMVLYQIFSTMIDDLPIEIVIQLLSEKQIIRRMPFGKHQGKLLNEIPKDYIAWLKTSGAFDKSENKALYESFMNLGLVTT